MGQAFSSISSRLRRNPSIILWFLTGFYLLSRIIFAVTYPIFNDEAIYLRYGKIMVTDQPFYSVTTIGKQPLLLWIYGFFVTATSHSLFFSRAISILAGLGSLLIIYMIGRSLGGIKTASIAAALYILSPIFVLFDSLAVVDGVLTFLFTVLCYLLRRIYIRFSIRDIILIACVIGIGLWIKSTVGLFFIISFIIIAISLQKQRVPIHLSLFYLLILTVIPPLILFPLIVHPEFIHIFRFQQGYALTIPELLWFPARIWVNNIVNTVFIYAGYTSPFIFAAAFYTMISDRKTKVFSMLFLGSVFFLVFTARAINSRYVVFSAVPLTILAAVTLSRYAIPAKITLLSSMIVTMILLASPVLFFRLYPQIGIWKGENWQHINGWPSGYGVMEALRFVNTHRAGNDALVGVRWDSGNPEDTILLFAQNFPGLEATFLDVKLAWETEKIVQQHAGKPIYFITRDHQYGGLENALTVLARFPKPDGNEAVEVYLLNH